MFQNDLQSSSLDVTIQKQGFYFYGSLGCLCYFYTKYTTCAMTVALFAVCNGYLHLLPRLIPVVCAAAEKLVYVCVEDYNKTIVNFRSHDFCSKYC